MKFKVGNKVRWNGTLASKTTELTEEANTKDIGIITARWEPDKYLIYEYDVDFGSWNDLFKEEELEGVE